MATNKTALLRKEVDELKDVMIDNIEKALDRDEKIDNLISKTDELADQSKSFNKLSTRLKRQLCCSNCKTSAILLTVILLVISFIIFIIVISIKKT